MLEHVDLTLPDLPECLEGMTVAHVTDLHIDRHRRRHNRIYEALRGTETDLALFTGDYMNRLGDEAVTLEVMARLCGCVRARLGMLGVFGNHESKAMRRMLRRLPIRWLCDECCRPQGLPLEITGVDAKDNWPGDALALLENLGLPGHAGRGHGNGVGHGHGGWQGAGPGGAQEPRALRLMLAHYPGYLPTAADLGVDLVFSGHTHGGQCRIPPNRALHNSSDLPMHLTSGILRHRRTLCVVSRGLGESMLPLRLFCPPHIPVYTIRRGPLAGEATEAMVNLRPW
jgi:predicted MPP superfamily phosphohydrolase